MSIQRAEDLKREWTDKYVIVNPEIARLKRFQNLTGTVKTVNMNCRALVEFDGPEDISWYDIDVEHLQVVDAPREKKKTAEAPAEEKKAPAKKAAAKTGGKSPLELARQQGAGGKSSEKPAGKKLSPLEMARQQDAAKKAAAQESQADEGSQKPAQKPGGKKLSPLEQARQQDAAKKAEAEESQAEKSDESPAPAKPKPSSADEKKLSPLERARMQDKKDG